MLSAEAAARASNDGHLALEADVRHVPCLLFQKAVLLRGRFHERQVFRDEFQSAYRPRVERRPVIRRRAGIVALVISALLAIIGLWASPAVADEGMWTFDAFPSTTVERTLGVRLDSDWLDHLRAGSVRLTSGCSGAVVSPRGMVVTNQHCILGCAQSLSDAAHDHLTSGFGVGVAEPPRTCPALQAEILVGIADITGAVFKASAGKYGDDFVKARETILAQAERIACDGDRRYRCQVISFFGGGQFKVYRYRRYDDVRLVFAPEFPVAFFGGDPENFTYPRYDLDVAVLRLYERGRPASTPTWLNWSARPPMAGEAVFVSGSPGTTQRALTVTQLETLRDLVNPDQEVAMTALRARLLAFSRQGPDERRLAADRLFNVENSLKVLRGQTSALRDSTFMAARRADEAALKSALAADAVLRGQVGDPWGDLDAIKGAYVRQFPLWRQLEVNAGGGSRLFWYARTLVRGAAERARRSAERLPEYSDARLPLIEKGLLDDQPIDPRLEALHIELWLTEARSAIGAGDPAANDLLGGAEPSDLARRLAEGSRLGDPAVRSALWKGGLAAIQASDDPLIAYVRKTDPLARAARQVWENDVLGPTEAAAERIARVRFVVRGSDIYPDATFSPRISFGRVEGWREPTAEVAPYTTLGGLFAHATDVEPRRLPARWLSARDGLDLSAVLNFVTTNDIVGGNSGSPVVDARGQMVGAAFDGNQASIAGDFAYDGAANRTVVVSTAAINEALGKVYGRPDILRELQRR
jgi:hypothetical protein